MHLIDRENQKGLKNNQATRLMVEKLNALTSFLLQENFYKKIVTSANPSLGPWSGNQENHV